MVQKELLIYLEYGLNNLKRNNMNNNLEFENEDPSPDSIEDNHPRTNYGEGYYEKAKQETTLEEAAENYAKDIGNKNGTAQFDFIRGARWQAEKMYSEEDMIAFAKYCNLKDDLSVRELLTIWFDQYKKK